MSKPTPAGTGSLFPREHEHGSTGLGPHMLCSSHEHPREKWVMRSSRKPGDRVRCYRAAWFYMMCIGVYINPAFVYNHNAQISGCCIIRLKRLNIGSWSDGTPSSVIVGLQSPTGVDPVECEPTASGCSSLRFYTCWTFFNPQICDVINAIGNCSVMVTAAATFPSKNSVGLVWSQEFLPSVDLQRRATDSSKTQLEALPTCLHTERFGLCHVVTAMLFLI